MAQMTVAMNLSLVDTASGPLRAFIGHVERLTIVANRLGPRLKGVADGINLIGAAASKASSVSALAAALGRLSPALAAVRQGATQTAGAVSALTAGTGRLSTQLAAATAGMHGFGGATRAAGSAAQAGARGLNAAGAAAQNANVHVSSLATTLRGMAQLWAAAKIKDGLVGSAKAASDYETSQARAKTMGLTGDERGRIETAALGARQLVPQFDRRQTFEMAIDLKNAMNDLDAALKVLPEMAQFAQNLKSQTKDGKIDENILVNVGKILQQRGAVQDPAKMRAESDMLLKIMTATQGRVNINTMFGNLAQMKGALSGDNVSRDFLPILAGLAEMNRGGNGGVLGTQLTTATRYVMGNVKHGGAAKATNAMGLFEDPDGLKWNKAGNIDLQKSNLRMKGARLWQENPMEWVKQYLIPAMQAKGMDITDNNLVGDVVNQIMPARNAAEVVQTMTTKRVQLDKDAANVNRAMGSKEQTEINSQTSQAKWDALTGKMRDLAIVVGEKLLPVLRVVADVMGKMLDGVGAFFTAFPATATFLVWAAAIGGVVMAFRGFTAVFGIIGGLRGLLGGLGGSATASGTAISGFVRVLVGGFGVFPRLGSMMGALGTTVMAVGGLVARGFLRMIPLVGTLLLAWDLGKLLLGLIPGGDKIIAWFGRMFDKVIDLAGAAWRKVTGFITGMFPSANASTGRTNTGGATGSWESGTSGVTGSWGDDDNFDSRRYAAAKGKSGGAVSFATGSPDDEGGGGRHGGSGGKSKEREIGWAILDGVSQQKSNFLRSEKDVYDELPKIEADRLAEKQRVAEHEKQEAKEKAERHRAEMQQVREEIAAEREKAEIEKARPVVEFNQAMRGAVQGGMGDAFSSILRGTESAGKAMERFAQGIKNTFLDLIGKKLGDSLAESMFGGLLGGKSGQGGLGGLVGSLFDAGGGWLNGLFGGGGGGGVAQMAGVMGGSSASGGGGDGGMFAGLGNFISGLWSLDTGTDYVPHDMLALIHKGERVMPAKDNAAFSRGAGGGGSPNVQLSVHPDAMRMTMGDWLQGEMARQMATR